MAQFLNLSLLLALKNSYFLNSRRAGEMTQPIKCLTRTPVQFSEPKYKSLALWCPFVIPGVGRQRKVDPWGSLASQPSLLGEL